MNQEAFSRYILRQIQFINGDRTRYHRTTTATGKVICEICERDYNGKQQVLETWTLTRKHGWVKL